MDAQELRRFIDVLVEDDWDLLETVDPTDAELEEMDAGRSPSRDSRKIIPIGQTDTEDSVFAYADPVEYEKADIVLSSAQPGGMATTPGHGYTEALEAVARALLRQVPDQYIQNTAFYLPLTLATTRPDN